MVLLLLLGGCPSTPPGGGDAGEDGGGGPDGGSSGVTLRFVDEPAIPITENDVTVTDMELSLKDLRVIGDSSSGEGPTYQAAHVLSWEGEGDPADVTFPGAPTGIYSRFATKLATSAISSHAYRIRGTVVLDGVTYDFEIEDDGMLDVELDLGSVELGPGQDMTVRVRCDLAEVALSLDWRQVVPDGDQLEVESDSPLMAEIRSQVLESLEIIDIIVD